MPVTRPALLALLLIACADSDPSGDTTDTSPGTTSDAPLFPDVGDTAAPDAALDTSPETSATADSPNPTDTVDPSDSPDLTPDVDTDPCDPSPCTARNRTICIADGTTWTCACDPGHVLVGDACEPNTCDTERVRTTLTVHDLTPLPNTANPVRTGFDPLLGGDRVKVVIDVERVAGTRPLRVAVFSQRLVIDPTTMQLDAQSTPGLAATDRQLNLTVDAAFTSGRLSFEATVAQDGPPALGLDVRVFTDTNCPIAGSASAARLQLAGTRDPKTPGCVDMSDVRSLQLSDAIPDKDTSVYEQRNGTFAAISTSHKILTQMTVCLERSATNTVALSGSADGTRPWTIDNFLLIERFDTDPEAGPAAPSASWLTTSTGATAPGRYADQSPITIIKHASLPGDLTGSRTPSAFSFPANVLQLDALMPVGQRAWFRFTGLDTGVAGHLSRLFVVSHPADTTVPECRTHLDCPRPDSVNGFAIAIRSGCLSGRCAPVTCDAGCPLGQRCLQGFCTDGCETAATCPTGSTCAMGQCVAPVPGTSRGACASFSDCPLGEVCLLGRCEPGCFHPTNQDPTYGGNHSASVCRQTPAACPRCPGVNDRCWYGYCRQCEIDSHCASGQRCADTTCVPR